MANDEREFDTEAAWGRIERVRKATEEVQSGLWTDVVNWYKGSAGTPSSEEDERKMRTSIRKYVVLARDRLNDILDNL